MRTIRRIEILPTTLEEEEIVESWGSDWEDLQKEQQKEFGVLIMIGDWSGYKAGQYRITHITRAPIDWKKTGPIGRINFGDGTTMDVWVERITLKTLFKRGLKKKDQYSQLIEKLIKSGMSYYDA